MNLIPDPSPNGGRAVPAAYMVLASWYAAHSAVRRLWAIKDPQRMRIIVTLEPTPDSDDTYPAWLANSRQWAHELQSRMEEPVQLEVMAEALSAEFSAGVEGVLFAQLFWRDSSIDYPPDDAACGSSPAY